ncbi:MAG: MiaB/RimO family radical SAM methylthiotransferase [Candidatus Fermentibacteraceae bacterium]
MGAGNPVFPAAVPVCRPRVFGYTLGCRLNSCETDAMVSSLAKALDGTAAASHRDADIIIVNTCTVTGRSAARCRKAVKGFRQDNPGALLIVTGCAAQIDPGQFAGIDNCQVVGNTCKESLPELVKGLQPNRRTDGVIFPSETSRGRRTRAFLKVQDGCDNLCTYCIVPLARGSSRSQPREVVISQAKELSASGAKEICLVGVDLADYGKDLYGKNGYGLSGLVRDLLETGGFRVRLSSLEPMFLTTRTLEELALPGVCRHFHIPLQSGSSRILSLMGRNYSRAREEELLSCIHSLFPGVCIGADIIAGFPGETGEDHAHNISLAQSGLLAYLHVFPYSPRPGTPAAEMKGVPPGVAAGRAGELRQLSDLLRRGFRESMKGSGGLILVEGRRHGNSRVGLTDNYIPVAAPHGSREGELCAVTLNDTNILWRL